MVSRKDVGVFLSFLLVSPGLTMALMHKDFTMKDCLKTCSQRRAIFVAISIKISTPSVVLRRLVSIGLDVYAGLGLRTHGGKSIHPICADECRSIGLSLQVQHYKTATAAAIRRWRILGTSKCPPP